MAHRHVGIVKTVLPGKGFGFIKSDVDGAEYFFHYSGCSGVKFDELQIGTRVSFIERASAKGPRAEAIERA